MYKGEKDNNNIYSPVKHEHSKKGNIEYVTNVNNTENLNNDSVRRQFSERGHDTQRTERSRTSIEF